MIKNPPADVGDIRDVGSTPGWNILAWRIPMDQRSLAGYSPWIHKELDMTE